MTHKEKGPTEVLKTIALVIQILSDLLVAIAAIIQLLR